MDILTSRRAVVNAVSQSGLIRDAPFVLVDVGCSFGIDSAWRAFAPFLRAYGFDPNASEIGRLIASEMDPGVRYFAGYVGLAKEHPFMKARSSRDWWGNNPWNRLAVKAALARRQQQASRYSTDRLEHSNIWAGDEHSNSDRIELPVWLESQSVHGVDFLKLDTDGEDLAILSALVGHLGDLGVLGVGVEVNFFGTNSPTDHTFHNIDRLMRQEGFDLFDLTLRRYANAALPSPFVGDKPGKSLGGRILQGDALYLRDMAAPNNVGQAAAWPPARVAKLACLFDMFGLPDCAAEILLTFRHQLQPMLRVDDLLDQLVPRRLGRRLPYRTYMARFVDDDRMFYWSLFSRPGASLQFARRQGICNAVSRALRTSKR